MPKRECEMRLLGAFCEAHVHWKLRPILLFETDEGVPLHVCMRHLRKEAVGLDYIDFVSSSLASKGRQYTCDGIEGGRSEGDRQNGAY